MKNPSFKPFYKKKKKKEKETNGGGEGKEKVFPLITKTWKGLKLNFIFTRSVTCH